MSDTHLWPASSAVDGAFAEFAAHRDRLRTLAHLHGGDDGKPVREALLAELFALDVLEERMRLLLAGPVAVEAPAWPYRGVGDSAGEQTGAWIRGEVPQMRRNRGPQ